MLDKHDAGNKEQSLIHLTTGFTRTASKAFQALKEESADVIPWSGQPFAFDSAEALMALPEQRIKEYTRYIRAYQLVLEGETSTTEEQFASALGNLLEIDADYAWMLAQCVIMPHMQGLSAQQEEEFYKTLENVPSIQENRKLEMSLGLSNALEKCSRDRTEALDALKKLSVMYDPTIDD